MKKIASTLALSVALGMSGGAQAAAVASFVDTFTFGPLESYAAQNDPGNTVVVGSSATTTPYNITAVRWSGMAYRSDTVLFTIEEDLAATVGLGGSRADLFLGGVCADYDDPTAAGCAELTDTPVAIAGEASGSALNALLGALVNPGDQFSFTFFEIISDAALESDFGLPSFPPDAFWSTITFEIEGTLVPIPAAFWLFAPALAGLAAFRRRRTA